MEQQLVKYMKGLLLLQLHTGKDGLTTKAEILLSKAGFTHKEIGTFLSKNPEAVAKTISRAK